jgi:hypothetical protein
MGLGERCDEIVRLIDETLAAFGVDAADAVPTSLPGPVAPVTPFPPAGPGPDRAVSGF